MKINRAIDPLQAGTSQAAGLKGERAGTAAHKPQPEATGSVPPATGAGSLSISQLSAKLQTLQSRLADGDSFDAARVSEIKQSIRDGSFKVNAEAVADKLLASGRDLFINRH